MPSYTICQAAYTIVMVLESADAVQGPTHTHPVIVLEHIMRTTYIDVKAQAMRQCTRNGE